MHYQQRQSSIHFCISRGLITNMVKELVLLALFLLCSSYFTSDAGQISGSIKCQVQKTWCIAKPSLDKAALQRIIDYTCSQIDCSILNSGCPCFLPADNLLINRASFAMNLYYQAKGRNPWNCDFYSSGVIAVTDPSYGDCDYQ